MLQSGEGVQALVSYPPSQVPWARETTSGSQTMVPSVQLSSWLAGITLMVTLHILEVSLCYIHSFHSDPTAPAESR